MAGEADKEKDNKDKKDNAKKEDTKKEDAGTLTESDIAMFKRYGKGPYALSIKKAEDDIKDYNSKISILCGIKESDTGLALPS